MEENNIRFLIAQKQEQLNAASKSLKTEFFGIDSTIDQIIEAISSWFLFPNIQRRPVIVNLWGLTGVGKSSLVSQLASLLDFKSKFYRFDLGEKSASEWVIKRNLTEIFGRANGFPVILAFDEFQHARTLDEENKESEQMVSRIVWEILDSGKFQYIGGDSVLSEVYELMLELSGLLREGMYVKNGKIIDGISKLRYESRWGYEKNTLKTIDFVPESNIEGIFWCGRSMFDFPSDVRKQLDELDGPGTIQFLRKVMEAGESPKVVDCSKALIFVVGNLDEAYNIGGNMNPDIDADTLHKESLKINLGHVKRALKKRFRYEQIARLGNTHIVYPALKRETFFKIIEKELNTIAMNFETELGFRVKFDSSVVELVYREGAFPTQGARPLFTTINQLISSKIGLMALRLVDCVKPGETILISADENVIRMSTEKDGVLHPIIEEKLTMCLDPLRKSKPDDLQAITAVHESGHAIVAMALRGIVPTCIFSRTADSASRGFVHLQDDADYLNRAQMIQKVAEYFGGIIAEEIIYGKEHVTSGSESDMRAAGEFVGNMVKACGMGSILGRVAPDQLEVELFLHDKDGEAEKNIQQILADGSRLAIDVLLQEKPFLIELATALTRVNQLRSEEIRAYACLQGSSQIRSMLNKTPEFSYRIHLLDLFRQKAEQNTNPEKNESSLMPVVINLNSDKAVTPER